MKVFNKLRREELGSAAVEFALVLPALLLIVFAILEYGWYMTHQLTLANAVAAAARAGVKAIDWDEDYHQDPAQVARQVVRESFWLAIDLEDDLIEVNIYDDTEVGRRLEVKVLNLPYSSLTGYLPEGLLPKRLSAKAVMAFPH